jgi:hypothetical protein
MNVQRLNALQIDAARFPFHISSVVLLISFHFSSIPHVRRHISVQKGDQRVSFDFIGPDSGGGS